MAYTSQSAPSSYNQSPPADDGTETASNQVFWSTIKTKLADPLKTFVESVNTAVSNQFTAMDKLTTDGDLYYYSSGYSRLAIGTASQVLAVNSGATAPEWVTLSDSITSGTAQSTASGSAIDFTSIPSGTLRITMNFSGVSLTGTDDLLVQIGDSGGIETTSYDSNSISHAGTTTHGGNVASTSGFVVDSSGAATGFTGRMVLELLDSSTNTWIATHNGFNSTHITGNGSKSLSATLDRIRLTRTGSDTFDAGTVNILYE